MKNNNQTQASNPARHGDCHTHRQLELGDAAGADHRCRNKSASKVGTGSASQGADRDWLRAANFWF